MKKSVSGALCAVLLLVAGLFLSGCQDEEPMLQINDVVSDPGAFSGALSVEGVVYAYAKADPNVLGVMDKKELQCTTPNCEKVLLPVRVVDSRPAIGDEVRVSGTMTREDWGYLLQADSLEVVANHKLGGAG